MDLILWRHAQAEIGNPDMGRELTQLGRNQAAKMGAWLDMVLPSSCRILSSGSTRTLQTVETLGRKYKVVPEINPYTNPQDLLSIIDWPSSKIPILVVGHQPWLGQLAALTLIGENRNWTIKKSNVWWISAKQNNVLDNIYLKAVLSPNLLVK